MDKAELPISWKEFKELVSEDDPEYNRKLMEWAESCDEYFLEAIKEANSVLSGKFRYPGGLGSVKRSVKNVKKVKVS